MVLFAVMRYLDPFPHRHERLRSDRRRILRSLIIVPLKVQPTPTTRLSGRPTSRTTRSPGGGTQPNHFTAASPVAGTDCFLARCDTRPVLAISAGRGLRVSYCTATASRQGATSFERRHRSGISPTTCVRRSGDGSSVRTSAPGSSEKAFVDLNLLST